MGTNILALRFVLVIFVTLQINLAAASNCIRTPESADVDEDFLRSVRESKHGWYVPIGSKMEKANSNPHSDPIPPDNTTLKTRRCWSAQLKTPIGAIPMPMHCRLDYSNKQSCALKTTGTPVHKFVRYFGEFTATLTDNKNHLTAYGCLLGSHNYWVTLMKTRDGLHNNNQLKKEILDHIEELGFDRDNMKSDRDFISIDRMKMVPCHNEDKKIPVLIDGLPGEEDGLTNFKKKK